MLFNILPAESEREFVNKVQQEEIKGLSEAFFEML